MARVVSRLLSPRVAYADHVSRDMCHVPRVTTVSLGQKLRVALSRSESLQTAQDGGAGRAAAAGGPARGRVLRRRSARGERRSARARPCLRRDRARRRRRAHPRARGRGGG
jgi:hypothetical protein